MHDEVSDWPSEIARRVAAIRTTNRWRHGKVFAVPGSVELAEVPDGAALVSFASNDYFGLSRDRRVIEAAIVALGRFGAGAGSSRLVAGTRPVHEELEAALAAWKKAEAALVFPTGYAANLGVLSALGGSGTTILSDSLNHASIIDGCRLARAAVRIYRHRDLEHLEALLENTPRPSLVVSETVFSMDGDRALAKDLAVLCDRFGAALVLDEAHGALDAALELEGSDLELLHVGTLSKSLGSQGGFVAGRASTIALIENQARSYIFTTALSPPDTASALRALQILTSKEGETLRARLAAHVEMLMPGHHSPIVPIVLGDEQAALDASRELLRRGLYVPAIRPPTVPAGSSRLRVSLSAAHRTEHVTRLRGVLEELQFLPQPPRSTAGNRSFRVPRPIVVAIAGTGTDVGKTFVAAQLIRALRQRGRIVAARKPLQSYAPEGGPTDAQRLSEASGESPASVSSSRWSYPLPLAPPMAAEALGLAMPQLNEVAAWFADSLEQAAASGVEVVVVELVGGMASPHTVDSDGLGLLQAIRPNEVLLVARPGLGTLNDIGLALRALREVLPELSPKVLLNGFDGTDSLHRANLVWLRSTVTAAVFPGDEAGCLQLFDVLASTVSLSFPLRGEV